MRLSGSPFAARRMTLVILVPALLLIGMMEAHAQGVRGLPLVGRLRGVPWDDTPGGIAIQVGVAALLAVFLIWVSARFRPGPSRRKGPRSFLENPMAPMPTWDPPEEAAGPPPQPPNPPDPRGSGRSSPPMGVQPPDPEHRAGFRPLREPRPHEEGDGQSLVRGRGPFP
jgi:hypothetical protein